MSDQSSCIPEPPFESANPAIDLLSDSRACCNCKRYAEGVCELSRGMFDYCAEYKAT